jgi:hypothetical protein
MGSPVPKKNGIRAAGLSGKLRVKMRLSSTAYGATNPGAPVISPAFGEMWEMKLLSH